jgi:hypothetical protein
MLSRATSLSTSVNMLLQAARPESDTFTSILQYPVKQSADEDNGQCHLADENSNQLRFENAA